MKWVITYWAKVGGLIGFGILCILFFSNIKFSKIELLLWIHLAILLIHQFEEYVYPGGFKVFFNTHIYNKNKIIKSPLTDYGILIVNIVIAWNAYSISAIYNMKFLWLAIGLLLITLFNGILHTILAIINKKYNPGLISGFFIFIPFGIYTLIFLSDIVRSEDWKLGIGIFIVGTAAIPSTIYLTNKIY